MAKHKRQNHSDIRRRSLNKILKPSRNGAQVSNAKNVAQNRSSAEQPQSRPTIPFHRGDTVLLIGEGDFSFAHSLLRHHAGQFAKLTATTLEPRDQLLAKYPQAEQYIEALVNSHQSTQQTSHDSSAEDEQTDELDENTTPPGESEGTSKCMVLYSIDATKLGRYRPLTRHKWDRIAFNFPHVGGKSTDVNRQVRYNQELLSGFLHSAIHLLTPPSSTSSSGGTVLITIFEGEPYTLWNIRDLARHAGFAVLRSFKFDASAYPGYRHARTLGNLIAKNGPKNESTDVGEDGQARAGRWHGEERSSRTFEFGVKDALMPAQGHSISGGKLSAKKIEKRKRESATSSSETEE